jgi:hypothetical protein
VIHARPFSLSSVTVYSVRSGVWAKTFPRVRLAHRSGEVYLDGAGANPGFVVEAEQTGPNKVEVEFRSETHESELHAAWEDNGLDVQISESSEG